MLKKASVLFLFVSSVVYGMEANSRQCIADEDYVAVTRGDHEEKIAIKISDACMRYWSPDGFEDWKLELEFFGSKPCIDIFLRGTSKQISDMRERVIIWGATNSTCDFDYDCWDRDTKIQAANLARRISDNLFSYHNEILDEIADLIADAIRIGSSAR